MPKLLAIVNTAGRGLGRFEPWLTADGITVHAVDGADGLPETLDDYDGLILLGGGFMPTDDAVAAWLPAERRLANEAITRDLPTLGICLGAQVLAYVAGGTVQANSGVPERGSTQLTRSPAAANDLLFAQIPDNFSAIENHRDAVTALPAGAVLLASSRDCTHQAFRLGQHVWGVQFHPEVGADVIDRWSAEDIAADGLDIDTVRRVADSNEPRSERVCRAIASDFAAVVHATQRAAAI